MLFQNEGQNQRTSRNENKSPKSRLKLPDESGVKLMKTGKYMNGRMADSFHGDGNFKLKNAYSSGSHLGIMLSPHPEDICECLKTVLFA